MSWPDEVMGNYTHEQQRFRLVEIAFDRLLPAFSESQGITSWKDVGQIAVKAADSVLAAMETTPDIGSSAEEIERRALVLASERVRDALCEKLSSDARKPAAGELIPAFRDGFESGMECALKCIAATKKAPDAGPPADELPDGLEKSALARIRAEIQDHLDVDAKADAKNPTTNVRARGYREGVRDARKSILAMIDEAMGKADAGAVDDEQKGTT